MVLQRFQAAKLKLKTSKWELSQKEVKFLGHIVSREGVKTDPDKVQTVRDWVTPRCLTELKSFLGFVGYYRRFCPDHATLTKPLYQLASKNVPFIWTETQENAFQTMKSLMTEAPILAYPDQELGFIVDADSSNFGI